MSSCCSKPPESKQDSSLAGSSCCGTTSAKIDWWMWLAIMILMIGEYVHFYPTPWSGMNRFAHGVHEFILQTWWSIALGLLAVGVMSQAPKSLIKKMLGKSGSSSGIVRAVLAGLLLDACNHGILMIGAQLYKKGASLGQTMAFLISSPWNSFSLTILMFSLLGWQWALCLIFGSALIAFVTGVLVDKVFFPHETDASDALKHEEDEHEGDWSVFWQRLHPRHSGVILRSAWTESRSVLRWIFIGIALAAMMRGVITPDQLHEWAGPTVVGLLVTLVGATLLEVCSEGSVPIAVDLLRVAKAPGNAFAFLMAGASTDWTEMAVLRDLTGSWKKALLLPCLTVPQVLVIAYIMNHVRH